MFMFYVYCRYLFFSKWCGIQKHHIIDKIYKYLKYSLVPPPGVQSVSKTWRNFLLYCLVNFFFFTTRATTALVVFVSVLIMLVWNVTVTNPPGPPPRSFPLATGHSPAVAQMNKFNKVVCFPVLRPLIYLFIYSVVVCFVRLFETPSKTRGRLLIGWCGVRLRSWLMTSRSNHSCVLRRTTELFIREVPTVACVNGQRHQQWLMASRERERRGVYWPKSRRKDAE